MKILQVNAYESPGSRFHGLTITPLLKKYGIDSRHLVWNKDTNNPEVLTFDKYTKGINKVITGIERLTSLQSVLYQSGAKIVKLPAFQEADLIHLHIIHSGYFSMSDLQKISQLKPTIWTLHDPWAMTGHCIYPMDCKRWMIGCGSCPDLDSQFPLLFDTTNFLFKYKKKSYKKADFDIIVASKWMKDMVERSPIFENPKLHYIPFGLDLEFFSPVYTKAARKRFAIPDDTIVISFRGIGNQFKGVEYIIQALNLLNAKKQICIIVPNVDNNVIYQSFREKFRIIEFKWLNDDKLMRDIMAASDIFLMPSTAEAFGMMAIEALACGKPIIVFEGTSLPDVTFAPDVGVSVPMRDSVALYKAIQSLIDDDEERINRGKAGRIIAETHYDQQTYVQKLADLYNKVANQK